MSEDSVNLVVFLGETTKKLEEAGRAGLPLMIDVAESWAVGTHPEVGPYKIDVMSRYTGIPDPTSDEQYLCKSLSNVFMPIGAGPTKEEALERFIHNQTLGEETRLSGQYSLS